MRSSLDVIIFDNSFADCGPIPGILSATKRLTIFCFFDFSIDTKRFWTDFSLYQGRAKSSCFFSLRVKISAKSLINQSCKNNSTCCVPRPSISNQDFPTL